MNLLFWDEIVVIALMTVAALLGIACHNDHHIKESLIKTAGRRLVIAAQLLVIVRLVWLLRELGDVMMTLPFFLVFLLWGLGSIMSSLDHIARRWGREISELTKPKIYYERRKQPREKKPSVTLTH